MSSSMKVVLSASRRTDIPAFYMPWFMESINRGFFEVTNPYNKCVSMVPASTDQVGAIVFWSKNFGPFLERDCGRQLEADGYRLFFNFTINSPHPVLEPGVPTLAERLHQLKELNRRYGPGAVTWRLDPICWYRRTPRGGLANNLDQLDRLLDAVCEHGTRRCVTSFLDLYAKVRRRAAARGTLTFVDPPLADKIRLLLDLEQRMAARNIKLQTCCEKDVIEALPAGSTVTAGACISNSRLMSIYGGNLSLCKDRGQRVAAGCGCQVSVDVGSYDRHPCFHNCLFCYANPCAPDKRCNG